MADVYIEPVEFSVVQTQLAQLERTTGSRPPHDEKLVTGPLKHYYARKIFGATSLELIYVADDVFETPIPGIVWVYEAATFTQLGAPINTTGVETFQDFYNKVDVVIVFRPIDAAYSACVQGPYKFN